MIYGNLPETIEVEGNIIDCSHNGRVNEGISGILCAQCGLILSNGEIMKRLNQFSDYADEQFLNKRS